LVYGFCRLQAPFFSTYGMLWLGSLVGLAVGLCISASSRSVAAAIATLPIVLLPFIILGGGIQPLHRQQALASISVMVPTRWVFEADMLLENSRRTSGYEPPVRIPGTPEPARDVAAIHFPADRTRTPVWRAAAYLGVMIAGWMLALAVILKLREPK
jgi:hypothetical protein